MLNGSSTVLIRFLRWTEKYTKTDMVYLSSGAVLGLVAQVVIMVASLVLGVAVNHFVSKEAYGTYKFVVSLVAMLSVFSLSGIGTAVFRAAAAGFDGALQRGFWENIRWSAGIFVGGFFLAAYYLLNDNGTLAIGLLIGACLSPVIASASLFGPFLSGKKDFGRQTLYGILNNVIPITIFVAVVLVTSDPLVLVAAYFVTNALAGVFFYWRTLAVYHADLHKQDEGLLSYSKHLSAMGIISGIADRIDQLLLFHYVGAAQLAVYNFAIAIPDQMKAPIKNLGTMMQAQFVRRSGIEIKGGMWNKIVWSLLGIGLLVATYVAAAPSIFNWLFPNYIDAVLYSQVFSLWLLSLALDPAASYLAARKLTKELYIINGVYSVTMISTLFIGVTLWGLWGVILARIFTRAMTEVLCYVLYRMAIERELEEEAAA